MTEALKDADKAGAAPVVAATPEPQPEPDPTPPPAPKPDLRKLPAHKRNMLA
ncbi:MAG: hypothetical protein NVV72_01325 [Asticcacaulis sp.]|nr:hypothetical protein [Asticcacaulis sp.]